MKRPLFSNHDGVRGIHWNNIALFSLLAVFLIAVLPILAMNDLFGLGVVTDEATSVLGWGVY